MAQSKEIRVVLLGKTGDGKSSSGNTILGDNSSKKFLAKTSPSSVTLKCEGQTGLGAGTKTLIKIIDTPGFFGTHLSGSEREIWRCITMNSPGPHAILILLKVERYTKQEVETISKIACHIGEEAFRYAVVLFTYGNDLDEDQTIEDFVNQSDELKNLVQRCGGRCHVLDNKNWNQDHKYRNNILQVKRLIKTIEDMVAQNGGGSYTNEMLKKIEENIQSEQQNLAEEMRVDIYDPENRVRAEERVTENLFQRFGGTLSLASILAAFLGIGLIRITRMLR